MFVVRFEPTTSTRTLCFCVLRLINVKSDIFLQLKQPKTYRGPRVPRPTYVRFCVQIYVTEMRVFFSPVE